MRQNPEAQTRRGLMQENLTRQRSRKLGALTCQLPLRRDSGELWLVRQECERQKCERHQCEANSANANSAKGSTVRMRQECECQMCECQQCDATSVRKKCDRCANDNSAKRTLCRDMHALLYRQTPEFWGSSKPLFSINNPFPNHNLTEIPLYPHPNPRTKTVWRVIRIDFHVPVFRRSVGLSDPTLTLTNPREKERD